MLILLLLPILASCRYQKDNIVEQFVEEALYIETGMRVDLSF